MVVFISSSSRRWIATGSLHCRMRPQVGERPYNPAFCHTVMRVEIRRANGSRRVRSCNLPVFAYYCTIFFDNMAPPWGVGWRKCDGRGPAEAPPDVSRGIRKTSKKNIAFLMQICFHLASNLAPFRPYLSNFLHAFFQHRFYTDFILICHGF